MPLARKSRYSPWKLRNTVANRGQGKNDVAVHGMSHDIPPKEGPRTQTAVEIFCGGDSDSTRRTGIIEGKRVTFELMENVTKKRAATSREERQKTRYSVLNARASRWEMRGRWWLMTFRTAELTAMYVAAYGVMNVVFAALLIIDGDKCCGDPDMKFGQVINFVVQTSTTIGYGSDSPDGTFANLLVFVISILSLILNSVYAGLLFARFVFPAAKIRFSEVMTLSNFNGVPCLELRLGNEDGRNNMLLNAHVKMTYTWSLEYVDERGNSRQANQTEKLKLLCDMKPTIHDLPWTVRHRLDENSQLFGLDLFTSQGSALLDIEVAVEAIQKVSGATVFANAIYHVEDIMVGHRFVDQIKHNKETRTGSCDYAKFDETVPEHVWYPVTRDEATENKNDIKRDDQIDPEGQATEKKKNVTSKTQMFDPEDQTSEKEKSSFWEEELVAPLVETRDDNLV